MGAEETSIAIVEDGILDIDSRQNLGFGSDDLITLFMELLKGIEFPYTSLSLSCAQDIGLLTELKERCWTLDDSVELSPQIFDFLVRIPGASTLSYHFKAFEERFVAPFTYFSPSFIDLPIHKLTEKFISNYFLSEFDSEVLIAEKTKKQILAEHNNISDELEPENSLSEHSISTSIHKDPLTSNSPTNTTKCNYCKKCFLLDTSASCCCFSKEPEIKDLFNHIKEAHFSLPLKDFTCEWISLTNENVPHICNGKQLSWLQLEMHIIRHLKENLNNQSTSSLPTTGTANVEKQSNKNETSSLHESILECILRHENPERIDKIKKWLSMILLVGGGHQISGFRQLLATKLNELATSGKYPSLSTLLMSIENEPLVSTISLPKDIDIMSLAWKGAGVVARVDSSRDTWISSKEWDALRLRAVVDRLPHIK